MPAWRRTYWAVFVSNLITAMGMMSFLPFFPSHLEALGLEDPDAIARWSGLAAGAAPLSAALMAPVWGALGDRFGRRLMVLRALLAIAVFVGLMAFARSPVELCLLRVGQGIFSGFVAPSQTLVSLAAPVAMQGRVTGSLQAALAAGSILGPAVGAAVSVRFGIQSVYLGVSLAALASGAVIVLFARESSASQRRAPAAKRSLLRLALEGWFDFARFLRRPALRSALASLFAIQFAIGATQPLLALYVGELTGGDTARVESLTAGIFSAIAVVLVVATPWWGRFGDVRGHRRALFVSGVGTVLALLLCAAAPGYGALLACQVLLGLATAGSNPSTLGVAALQTTADERGSAFGAVFSARALARSIAAMLGGLGAAFLGQRGLYLGAAGLLALALMRLGSAPEASTQPASEAPDLAAEPEFSTIHSGSSASGPQM